MFFDRVLDVSDDLRDRMDGVGTLTIMVCSLVAPLLLAAGWMLGSGLATPAAHATVAPGTRVVTERIVARVAGPTVTLPGRTVYRRAAGARGGHVVAVAHTVRSAVRSGTAAVASTQAELAALSVAPSTTVRTEVQTVATTVSSPPTTVVSTVPTTVVQTVPAPAPHHKPHGHKPPSPGHGHGKKPKKPKKPHGSGKGGGGGPDDG